MSNIICYDETITSSRTGHDYCYDRKLEVPGNHDYLLNSTTELRVTGEIGGRFTNTGKTV